MSIFIYFIGYIIAYIIIRKFQKYSNYSHNWKTIIKAMLLSIFSWVIVIFSIIPAIIKLINFIYEWYENNENKLRKPPKWL